MEGRETEASSSKGKMEYKEEILEMVGTKI